MRWSHGGQDAQHNMARGLLCGNHKGVAIRVVLHHRAARHQLGGGPVRLTSWKEKGLSWGSSVELTGLQKCVKNMISKKIKLVNVVQVMLFRRILPCQRRAFNMWEFDPAEHQMLHELFDTTHKDV